MNEKYFGSHKDTMDAVTFAMRSLGSAAADFSAPSDFITKFMNDMNEKTSDTTSSVKEVPTDSIGKDNQGRSRYDILLEDTEACSDQS